MTSLIGSKPVAAPDLRCPFCPTILASASDGTVEHVIPESWYPVGTPQSAMPKVISCKPCNRKYGKIEERLLRTFGLTAAADNPHADGVMNRVLRSLRPSAGRGFRDRYYREASFNKIRRNFTTVASDHPRALNMPNGPSPHLVLDGGVWKKGNVGLSFDVEDVDAVIEKFVRGLYLYERGENMPLEMTIASMLVQPCQWDQLATLFRQYDMPLRNVTKGVWYKFGVVPGHPGASIWLVMLWEKILFYGSSYPATAQTALP